MAYRLRGLTRVGRFGEAWALASVLVDRLDAYRAPGDLGVDARLITFETLQELSTQFPEGATVHWKRISDFGWRTYKLLKGTSHVNRAMAPLADYVLGKLQVMGCHPHKARWATRKALEGAMRLGQKHLSGICHLDLAQMYGASNPRRERHLGAAEACFRELSAAHELAQVQALWRP